MDEKRKSRIIYRGLQYQIIGIVAASGIAISLISAFAFRVLSDQVFAILQIANADPTLTSEIAASVNQTSLYFIGLVGISLAMAWAAAIYLSSRVAGPVYNINRTLDAYFAGDKTVRVKTRKNDFFSNLAERINKLLDEAPKG